MSVVTLGAAAGLLGVAARAALHRQAAQARGAIGKPWGETPTTPDANRVWRRRYGGTALDLLVIGDSVAAGLGAEHRKDTLGGRLAKGLGKALRRPVRLTMAAAVGAETSMVAAQLDGLPADYRPDVAVLVVGGNDVIHRVAVEESVAHLREVLERLREAGVPTVVGTCPDLGAIRPVPQPLRALGARVSRQLAAAQTRTAVDCGAHAVSLARVVGPFFLTDPEGMFSLDRFHPSAQGYRRTAAALVPSVLVALGEQQAVPPGHHRPLTPGRASTVPRAERGEGGVVR